MKRQHLHSGDELLRLESELRADGFCRVAGVDEAGRGPLAGPVVAAAVVLPELEELPGVFDSKQLTEPEREALLEELSRLPGISIGVGIASVEEIDQFNILNATHVAMRRAVAELAPAADFVLVDGLPVKGFPVPCRNVVQGDAKCAAIAAASIVAKVRRDRIMKDLDAAYPGYGLAAHKGYGTAEHLAALKKLGVTPVHRRSFRPVRELIEPPPEQLELW